MNNSAKCRKDMLGQVLNWIFGGLFLIFFIVPIFIKPFDWLIRISLFLGAIFGLYIQFKLLPNPFALFAFVSF